MALYAVQIPASPRAFSVIYEGSDVAPHSYVVFLSVFAY